MQSLDAGFYLRLLVHAFRSENFQVDNLISHFPKR